MNSVDWGSSAEVMTGSEEGRTRLRSSRFVPFRLAERLHAITDVRARRIAAGLLVVAFILVVAAQWKPWFRLGSLSGEFSDSSAGARSVGAINALYTLAIPYYVGWMLIAMASGAAVLGRKRIRRAAAGVAAGALAGQSLVVLGTWHDNGIGLYRGLAGTDGVLHSTRQSGMYIVLAALVVTALAVVVAVRGRVLPSGDDEDDEDAVPVVRAADDDEHFRPSSRRGVRAGTPWVDRGEELDEFNRQETAHLNGYPLEADGSASGSTHDAPTHDAPTHDAAPHDAATDKVPTHETRTQETPATEAAPARVSESDHSMYMRPQDANTTVRR